VGPTGTDRGPSEYADLLRKLEAARETDAIEQALAAAREHLAMDAAYVTTVDAARQTIDAVVGERDLVDRYQGSVLPVEETYCARMLDGQIPNAVKDTRTHPALRDLAVTREFGAYVGVPVQLSDGRVHGTLCCVSHESRTDLGEEQVRFMQVLAGIVAARIDQARGDLTRLTHRLDVPSEYADAIRQIRAARETDVIERALAAARERLGMDAAYIATVDSRKQTIEAMVGSTNAEALVEGAVIPVDQTYCARMLSGEIPNIVADTSAEPALRKMTIIRNIGAYIGVPVTLSDGRLHGSLCCASNEPRSDLGEPELQFMRVLADIVSARVERVHGSMVRLTKRFAAGDPSD
jgi:GAF domain-containing protein